MPLSPEDLVQLPRLGASAALALGNQLITAATAKKVPKSAAKAHSNLTVAHAALQSALVNQFGDSGADAPDDAPATHELDRILDNCWGGTDDRLLGLSKLPLGTLGAAEAAAMRKLLFPNGLSFLKLPFRLEWVESQLRIDLIARDKLEPALNKLLGEQFFPAILAAHKNYGDALGVTAVLPTAAATPLVRGALDAFGSALRSYILKVMASVDEEEPATAALADFLLAPLAHWTAAAKRPAAKGATEGEGTPEKDAGAPKADAGSAKTDAPTPDK